MTSVLVKLTATGHISTDTMIRAVSTAPSTLAGRLPRSTAVTQADYRKKTTAQQGRIQGEGRWEL